MLNRRFLIGIAAAAVATLGLTGGTFAASADGTQAIADIGKTAANNADINLATQFFLDVLVSTGSNTGDFNAPNSHTGQFLGSATLDLGNIAAFTFGNAAFGSFVGSSYVMLPPSANSVNIYILGTYTPGTLMALSGITDAGAASFTIGFTQTGGPGSAISASGTLASPPAKLVPEPASLAMVGVGLLGLGLVSRKLRRA